ncbi:MAG: ABC transporter substrate-binding protein [Marinobacter sp.]|nr:ABC transporter substrate-binding protein [Marinobacter sp.]MDX1756718.1 ABC transporter substrate-binding protein [Marinobacter sp.]
MLAFALSAPASASEELREYVDENTQKLVQRLNSERGLYEADPEAFYRGMEEALSDFVDFRRIAARVMGRYARQATPDQRDEFVAKFKRSLFESYAQALVETEEFSIEVKDAVINANNDSRAAVQLEVISSSGNRYPVTYSMYLKEGQNWMMENVIVEGVNIGLAFRDRFSQEMEANRGDIQAVIDGWSDAVKDVNIEGEAGES